MFGINLHLSLLLLIINDLHCGGTVNYNPYAANQQSPYLLHNPNNNDGNGYRNLAQQSISGDYNYAAYQQYQNQGQNLPGNSNYQQLYRYYTPPYQQRQQHQQQPLQLPQQHLQPHQTTTQLWSGQPIVVEDDIQQERELPLTPNHPTPFYQQYPITTSLYRNSKVYQPPATTTPYPTTNQPNYLNKNNDNIIYHRDFRYQMEDAIPVTTAALFTQPHRDNVSGYKQQPQQQTTFHQPQQREQFYATNTNLRYKGISNYLISLGNDNGSDYREHFKRYLEKNPRRIEPIY